MSGTLGGIYNSVSWAISEHSKALAKLQEQAATGKRVIRVSDDPSDAYRIMGMKNQDRKMSGYISSINDIYDFINTSSVTLQSISDKMTSQRATLTSVLSAIHSSNEETRQNFARGVDELIEDMVNQANHMYNGQYVFGGDSSDCPPYSVVREDGKIVRVEYQGSTEERKIQIGDGMEVAMNVVGQDLFKMNTHGQTYFYGQTGAAAGTASSSIEGNVWLDIETEPGGYKLSIDGGKSWTTVAVPPGDTNTAVTHSQTGKVLFVDTTGITQPGSEAVKRDGTFDIFNQLIEIRDLLENKRNLGEQDLQALTEAAIRDFNKLHDNVSNGFTKLGMKLGSLDSIKKSLENSQYDVADGISGLEEADIADISTDLARRETLYEMSLIVASKLFKLSILNYIN